MEKRISSDNIFPRIEDNTPSAFENELNSMTTNNHMRHHTIFPMSQIFAPGTFLVTGRVLATAIIYLSLAKAAVVQYQNLRNIPSTYFNLSTLRTYVNLISVVFLVLF